MEVKLVVVGGTQAGKEIPIRGPSFLIGRADGCHLRPQNKLVSRKHCAILVDGDSVAIEDFASTNGTYVNGQRVQRRRNLKNEDRIKISTLELEVRLAVSLEGKKKSKVHNVQEAAVRTVASSAAADEDLDISDWLNEEDDERGVISPPMKPKSLHDTHAGKTLDETTTIPAGTIPAGLVAEGKGKENQPRPKVPGQFQRPGKPMADNSRSAAEDALKQYFRKK